MTNASTTTGPRNSPPPGHNAQAATAIIEAYRQRTPGSAALAAEAASVFPSGVTHDSRHLLPYGIYAERAKGAHKWDVDGNRYIDYFGGHGALLLGHNHPDVAAATADACAGGTHFAAGHESEVRWGELVCRMVPSAQKVRFTASGTEASIMAVRLARAATGRQKIIRLAGHFHGWHDEAATGYASHFDGSPPSGVPATVAANSIVLEAGDTKAVRDVVAHSDIAAVVVEALGASTGMVPVSGQFLADLRDITQVHGTKLIFDEVITGFRVSPGGVQALSGVTPDLTTLAKILAGGLPGGAVAGREELLDLLDHAKAQARGFEKIYHPGTFNANPVSAAAGRATLDIIEQTNACKRAATSAERLRDGLNDALIAANVPWIVYGQSSAVHVFFGEPGLDRDGFDPFKLDRKTLQRKPAELARQLRLAMLVNGVDLSGWPGGLVSTAHSNADIDETSAAFAASISMLRRAGFLLTV